MVKWLSSLPATQEAWIQSPPSPGNFLTIAKMKQNRIIEETRTRYRNETIEENETFRKAIEKMKTITKAIEKMKNNNDAIEK